MRRFAGDRVRVIVFADSQANTSTTLVLDAVAGPAGEASTIARILRGRPEHEAERDETIALLERLAAAIGADYFFAGASLIEWRRMPIERLLSGPDVDFSPALIAWRAGLFTRSALARAWGFDVGDVVGGARGFERVWVRSGR
ncbi:MAG: hypothetical protein R3B09_00820 [Nannocystaceae bacterium]